jgi:hypothetical protein
MTFDLQFGLTKLLQPEFNINEKNADDQLDKMAGSIH